MVQIIGWLGVVSYVAAYASLSTGRLSARSVLFHFLNALGGLCLVVDAHQSNDMPNLVVNVIWMFIAIVSMVRFARVTNSVKHLPARAPMPPRDS